MTGIENKTLDQLNEIVKKEFPDLFAAFASHSPRYRYIQNKTTKDRFFWTTEKIQRGTRKVYVTGIYRYLKSKKAFKLVKQIGFKRRKEAKARAIELYNQNVEK